MPINKEIVVVYGNNKNIKKNQVLSSKTDVSWVNSVSVPLIALGLAYPASMLTGFHPASLLFLLTTVPLAFIASSGLKSLLIKRFFKKTVRKAITNAGSKGMEFAHLEKELIADIRSKPKERLKRLKQTVDEQMEHTVATWEAYNRYECTRYGTRDFFDLPKEYQEKVAGLEELESGFYESKSYNLKDTSVHRVSFKYHHLGNNKFEVELYYSIDELWEFDKAFMNTITLDMDKSEIGSIVVKSMKQVMMNVPPTKSHWNLSDSGYLYFSGDSDEGRKAYETLIQEVSKDIFDELTKETEPTTNN